jgi:hypothetical protein
MAQDNNSSDKDNGTRGGYPHGTIGANKALAREEFDKMIKDRRLNKCSNDIIFALHISEALSNAWHLTVGSREGNRSNIKTGFIGAYVRLTENIERAKKLLDSNRTLLKNWPKNPGITLGPDVGWCALETAYNFSQRILSTIVVARSDALGERFGMMFGKEFDYLAIDDSCIEKWIDAFIKYCEEKTLPPSTEWPGWQIRRDAISVAHKLLSECESAKQKLKDVPGLASTKQNTVESQLQPTKDTLARIGNADKKIWQMEEIAKSLVEWIGESQYEFKHEGEKFWQDYFERPYERNYNIFMQLQIMLLHVIDRSNFNRLIEWLKWYKSQIGKDLDEQRIKIRSECISVCESDLNLDNEKLNLRLIDSIHKIEGYTDELAKSLLNIARIMRQESQADGTEIASTKQKDEQTISQIIEQGEGQTVEFKETLEYDVKTNKSSKDVLLSVLKTIAGFLNADGGTLLIGVNDSGEIKGIERDLSIMKHGNSDRFEQKIRNCLRDRFRPQPIGKIEISFEKFYEGTVGKFTEGTICRIDVPANKDVIHLDGYVYVRDGNTTQKLEGRDLTDWIQQRGK